METTAAYLRRQGRLLLALVNRAEEALTQQDRLAAARALEILERRWEQRIALTRASVFSSIERRLGHLSAIDRLQEEENEIASCLREVLSSERALPDVLRLKSLLEAHLGEEEQVVWPIVEFRA